MSTRKRALGGAAVVVGCVLASGTARAAGGGSEPADLLFKAGMEAVRADDLARARHLFEASCRLAPRGGCLLNLGNVEVELGELVPALTHLRQSMQRFESSDPRRALAQRHLDDAYAKTGHLTVQTKTGATVSVDGSACGPAPLADPVDVLPGRRVLEARLEGQVVRREIDVAPGVATEVTLSLPEPAPKPIAPEPAARLPQGPPSMPPALPPPAAPSSWWTAPRIAGVGAGAGAMVAFGLATYFHAVAQSASDDATLARSATGVAEGACPGASPSGACAHLQSELHRMGDANTASNVSWGIGGAFAVGSAVAFVVGAMAPPRSVGWSVRPAMGFGTAGLEGEF